jgi:hypothetical protein
MPDTVGNYDAEPEYSLEHGAMLANIEARNPAFKAAYDAARAARAAVLRKLN